MWLKNLFESKELKEQRLSMDKENIPVHVGIIMDGNGRWAKKRSLPRKAGHKAGADNLDKISKLCRDIGIKYLTVYAFSTENWKRPKEEVDVLMNLFLSYLLKYEREFNDGERIILKIIGDRTPLSDDINKKIDDIERMLEGKEGMVLNLAVNYGGRDEIINAVKSIIKEETNINDITEEKFSEFLYTKHSPDPDLIIRTSGEKRLSNFLTWQSTYSEIYVADEYWPDFGEKELLKAICDFQNRHRRFGGV